MAEQIKDGVGKAYLVQVDSDNRLRVRGSTESEEIFANRHGDAYNLNTGVINLTSAAETTLFYMKNNEDHPYVVTAVVIGVFNSVNGDGLDMLATFIRNPTTGDIITNAN
jgi:predicted RNA-binding protein (virulence factor B family)